MLTKGKLLKSTAGCLREHEEDKGNLKRDPAAVADEIAPRSVLQADGVDECGEEASAAAEKLEKGNTTRSVAERPDLHEIGCEKAAG